MFAACSGINSGRLGTQPIRNGVFKQSYVTLLSTAAGDEMIKHKLDAQFATPSGVAL
jgi:hypothetical protein